MKELAVFRESLFITLITSMPNEYNAISFFTFGIGEKGRYKKKKILQ